MSVHDLTPLTSPSDTSLCRRLVLSWKTSDSETGDGSVTFEPEHFAVSLYVNRSKCCKFSRIQKPQLIYKMHDRAQHFTGERIRFNLSQSNSDSYIRKRKHIQSRDQRLEKEIIKQITQEPQLIVNLIQLRKLQIHSDKISIMELKILLIRACRRATGYLL